MDTDFTGDIDNHIFMDDKNLTSSSDPEIKIIDPMSFNDNNIALLETNPISNNNNSTIIKIPSKCKINSVKRKPSNLNSFGARKIKNKLLQVSKKYLSECENVDESVASLSFIRWLVIYFLLI